MPACNFPPARGNRHTRLSFCIPRKPTRGYAKIGTVHGNCAGYENVFHCGGGTRSHPLQGRNRFFFHIAPFLAGCNSPPAHDFLISSFSLWLAPAVMRGRYLAEKVAQNRARQQITNAPRGLPHARHVSKCRMSAGAIPASATLTTYFPIPTKAAQNRARRM